MEPIWLRATNRAVDTGVITVFLLLCLLVLYESVRLGAGWAESGPDAGFFPFSLAILLFLGVLGVSYFDLYRHPDNRPFFGASDEVVDVLKVGVPIAIVVFVMRWLGLYITAGLYIGLFMAWYGRFRWFSALAGAILLPLILWLLLAKGFNIHMPQSMFYRRGILPF